MSLFVIQEVNCSPLTDYRFPICKLFQLYFLIHEHFLSNRGFVNVNKFFTHTFYVVVCRHNENVLKSILQESEYLFFCRAMQESNSENIQPIKKIFSNFPSFTSFSKITIGCSDDAHVYFCWFCITDFYKFICFQNT